MATVSRSISQFCRSRPSLSVTYEDTSTLFSQSFLYPQRLSGQIDSPDSRGEEALFGLDILNSPSARTPLCAQTNMSHSDDSCFSTGFGGGSSRASTFGTVVSVGAVSAYQSTGIESSLVGPSGRRAFECMSVLVQSDNKHNIAQKIKVFTT